MGRGAGNRWGEWKDLFSGLELGAKNKLHWAGTGLGGCWISAWIRDQAGGVEGRTGDGLAERRRSNPALIAQAQGHDVKADLVGESPIVPFGSVCTHPA